MYLESWNINSFRSDVYQVGGVNTFRENSRTLTIGYRVLDTGQADPSPIFAP
jgi:hypothetical protein